ncbi:MAG: GNAT family N-acetyltransferase [Planctomycetes bacterium]|nr:GNAT family N-acetyltransferase [Planctomycetota bacterium]
MAGEEAGPTIEGPSLALVPFGDRSITEEYLGWLNDPDLMRYSQQRFRRHTAESCREYLRSFQGSPNFFWSVIRRADSLAVGTMTAYVEPEHGCADIGILIGHPGIRGHGGGREAWGLGMAFLFEHRGMRKVTGGTVAANVPMVRIFLHWGMRLEGIRRDQQLIDGCPTDVLLFGTLAGEWTPGRATRPKAPVRP